VLTLQTGRYLVSSLRDLKAGKQLPEGVSYLYLVPKLGSLNLGNRKVGDLKSIQEAFDVTCAGAALRAGKVVESFVKKGASLEGALEKSSAALFVAAKLHCLNYLFRTFKKAAEEAPAQLKPILEKLCALFGLYNFQENAGSFLQSGYFTPKQMQVVDHKVLELLEEIRPQVIPLTDAFGLSDYVINLPLGCYDGDVYRRLMDHIKNRNPFGPHKYFEGTIKPVLHRKDLVKEVIQLSID